MNKSKIKVNEAYEKIVDMLTSDTINARCTWQSKVCPNPENRSRTFRIEEWFLPRSGVFVILRESPDYGSGSQGVDVYTSASCPNKFEDIFTWLTELSAFSPPPAE